VTEERSQRAFVAVTLTAVLAIAAAIVVYAAILGSLYGGEVTVGGVTGQIEYSLTNATGTWTSELEVTGLSIPWYARMNTTGGEYVGPANITWQLQKKGSLSDWSDATNEGDPTTTSIVLTSAVQTIYASTDGDISTNRDWCLDATSKASYRVIVTIQSTG